MNFSASLTNYATRMCAAPAVCPIPLLPTMPTWWPSEPATTSRRGKIEGEREKGGEGKRGEGEWEGRGGGRGEEGRRGEGEGRRGEGEGRTEGEREGRG